MRTKNASTQIAPTGAIGRRRSTTAVGGTLMALVALLALSACGSTTSSAATPAMELALGTIRLENTEQAVDAELASQLLPLWQLMEELDSNSSAAPEEVTAVVEKIQATMSADQLEAIDEMQLSQSDIVKATGGAGSATTGGSDAATSAQQSASAAAGGLMGQGMPPGDPGGGPMPGGGPQGSTNSVSTGSRAVTPSLFEQVIDLLESKT